MKARLAARDRRAAAAAGEPFDEQAEAEALGLEGEEEGEEEGEGGQVGGVKGGKVTRRVWGRVSLWSGSITRLWARATGHDQTRPQTQP